MKGVGAGSQRVHRQVTGGQKEVWCVVLCCWYEIVEERSELMGKGNVQAGSVAREVSVQASEEKNKRCEKDQAKLLVCQQQNSEAEQTCTLCADVDSNGIESFQAHARRCLSIRLILVKNMQRHAQTGTSLQL